MDVYKAEINLHFAINNSFLIAHSSVERGRDLNVIVTGDLDVGKLKYESYL